MKIQTFALYILLAFILISGAAFAQNVDDLSYPKLNKLDIPDVDKITLKNGMRLYILEDHSLPIFKARVRINCGSYLEPAEKIGLASICGSVIRTGGTVKWSGDELDEILEGIGGSVETSIGVLSGSANVNVLAEYSDLGLEILSQVLREPVFDEDKIELAKVEQRTSISRRNDDPTGIGVREFKKAIYGEESVYARHPEYATINAISREDLIDFHRTYFHPENMQIAVWGDFKKKDVIKKIKRYFKDWKPGGEVVPEPPEVDYKYESKMHYIYKEDVNQSNIFMGHIGGFVTDDDYAERIVMNSVLGGGFGSRLFNSVRSKEGLAYAAYGVYTARLRYPGVFYNYAATKSETTGKAINAIMDEIKRMQTDPPTEEEMKIGKGGYLNSFVFKFDSKSEVINRLMHYDFHGLPEDYIFQEKEKVEKVTPEDVLEAARNNLHPDAMHILVVGKDDEFDIPLHELGYGPVDTIDISIPSGEERAELDLSPEKLKKGTELLATSVKASGGIEKFAKIKSATIKGVFTMTTPQGEMPIPFEKILQLPNRNRTTLNIMGRAIYDILNVDKGWETGGDGNIARKTREAVEDAKKELNRDILHIFHGFKNQDYKVVYDGEGEFNGKRVDYVIVTDGDGEQACRIGIDRETSLPLTNSYWGKSPMGEGRIVEIYRDYSEMDGIKLPLNVESTLDGKTFGKSDFSEIIFNAEIPEGTFNKPE